MTEPTTAVCENLLACEIITPERPLFAGACASVVVPAPDGLVGILPGHAPFLSQLGVGVATVEHAPADAAGATTTERFAIRGGFLQVHDNRVTVLAVLAAGPGETTRAALEQEQQEALDALRAPATEAAFAAGLDARDWAQARKQLEDRAPNA